MTKTTMLKKLAPSLFLCTISVGALAQTFSDIQANRERSAYLQDSRGVIVRSTFGLCWRTGTWTPADAVPGCDGELVPPVAKPIAPAISTAPPPAPVAVAPRRCDFTVTLGADQSFAFDKGVLSSAAKARIDDEVMTRLASCAMLESVMVTGHADRLGSQQYNQRLSEKRAEAVAAYLKSKGISGEIDTLGAGKTQSVKACDDKLPRKQLIECLAPNRRVAIEVRGTSR
jgi:OmpA-OmpF porin, OOP family